MAETTTTERVYDRRGTCDACAEGDTPIRLDDPSDGNSAYVCQRCDDWFEWGVQQAALVLGAELGHTLASVDPPVPAPNTVRLARKVVEAFFGVEP